MWCLAEFVVPIDKVENSINIRLSPDASSDIVGRLDQGSSIDLISRLDGWYEVQLEGDATGYVSADWSRVVADEPVVDEVVEEVDEEAVIEEIVEEVADEPEDKVAADLVEETAEELTSAVAEEVKEVVTEPIEEDGNDAAEAVVEDVVEPLVQETANTVVAQDEGPSSELKGTRNFLVRFREENQGGNSQIFDNGNQVGIGTTSPKQRLEVNGSIQIHEQNSSVAGLMITQSSGDTGYIMHNRASRLTIGAGSQDRITIDRDGNVGFGVSRPEHPLEMVSGAHVTSGGVWTNSSSREKKENIISLPVDKATSALMAMEPVVFNYKNEVGENYVGFIAEDVPELVAVSDRNAISAMDIVAVLTRVVQEQQNKIKELEERLDAM